jgi:glycosyltransferase involved in cell wall biosynthesis
LFPSECDGHWSNVEKRPLVSVIIASYNCEKTLEAAIRSVLDQSYNNRELILIDGDSNDATLDIIKAYGKAFSYWVSEPDKGVYDALNKGIAVARGEWLYFLGADDTFIDNEVLEYFFNRELIGKMMYGSVAWGATGRVYDGNFPKLKICWRNICQQAIFYRRELFERFGLFDTQYRFSADWVFNMRCFADRETQPLYLDRLVACYAVEGLSTRNVDPVFARRQAQLVHELFGRHALFCFKLFRLIDKAKNRLVRDGNCRRR